MSDECIWHHKTFLVQSVYWHLAIKMYCILYVVLYCLYSRGRTGDLETLTRTQRDSCKFVAEVYFGELSLFTKQKERSRIMVTK